MLRYACLRLGLLVPVLLAASLIVFVLGRLAPGDPIALILAEQQSHPDVVERIRAEFGLDRPLPLQYLYWLRQAVDRRPGGLALPLRPAGDGHPRRGAGDDGEAGGGRARRWPSWAG